MKHKPLRMTDNWAVLRRATENGEAKILGSALPVLCRLLHHQNPRTGQCNPSIARIARDVGLQKRSVQDAINRLISRGYITRTYISGRTNQYRILRAHPHSRPAQSPAQGGAVCQPKPVQPDAPKKIYEKEKEKKPTDSQTEGNLQPRRLQNAEKDIVEALSSMGRTYGDLLNIPDAKAQTLMQAVAEGMLTPQEAAVEVSTLLKGQL